MAQEIKPKTIYLKTFGWPMVTVARDGAGDIKEDKCFGVKGLGQNEFEPGILMNVA